MKIRRVLGSFVFFLLFIGFISAAWPAEFIKMTGDIRKAAAEEAFVIKVDRGTVTLQSATDRSRIFTVPLRDVGELKPGDRVRILEGKLIRIDGLPAPYDNKTQTATGGSERLSRQQQVNGNSQEAADDERAASRLSPAERQRIDRIAAERQARMEQFRKMFAPQMKVKLADLRVKLVQAQMQKREKEINDFMVKIKQVSANPGIIGPKAKVMTQDEFALRFKQVAQQPALAGKNPLKVPSSKYQKPVKIKKIINAGSNQNEDTMEESSPALIIGENFGNDPGGAYLEYDICKFQEVFQSGACPEIVKVPLLPAFNAWPQSWNDLIIGVRLPALPQLQETHKITLVVATKTGAFARYDVQYIPTGYPSIKMVTAAPNIPYGSSTAIISGGMVLVEGNGFGANGQIWIDLIKPVNGQTKIFLQPGTGTWSTSWYDAKIVARVPKIMGDYWFQAGKLRVRNGSTGKIDSWETGFGPVPVLTMTSGIDYLEIDAGGRSGEDYSEESNGIVHVTHETKCNYWIFSSGNKGVDWFFRGYQGLGGSAALAVTGKKSFSPNCTVVRPMIVKVDPDETGKTIDFLINQIKNMLEDVLTESVSALWKKFFELSFYAVAGAFDSGVGKYGVWIDKAPSAKDPSLGVRWNNTCATISPLKGVPVEYMGNFLIYGPEGVCPGTVK